MAFLDNSGDIILDAVLTDAGRKRLARGDGTFKVAKYAFGDDEIDYSSYNAEHVSGSAYFDLEILQTPVLEAFTNNRSSMQSKLISLTNNNLLYLPVMVLNEKDPITEKSTYTGLGSETFFVAVDDDTVTALNDNSPTAKFLVGAYHDAKNAGAQHIRVDQGLDTTKIDASAKLSPELTERQYMIQIDNRLGRIYDVINGIDGSPSFIDDDQIATYYITQNVGKYVEDLLPGSIGSPDDTGDIQKGANVINGPRGTRLKFSLQSSDFLKGSAYLFDTIGGGPTTVDGKTYKYIDTTVKVTGVTTGYSLDIPVRFLKVNE